jgi:hypothetical protein
LLAVDDGERCAGARGEWVLGKASPLSEFCLAGSVSVIAGASTAPSTSTTTTTTTLFTALLSLPLYYLAPSLIRKSFFNIMVIFAS